MDYWIIRLLNYIKFRIRGIRVNRNRIFIERTSGVGAVDPETALNYSWSGPILRATGVDYDVRVNEPYSSYQDFDFEIPVGT